MPRTKTNLETKRELLNGAPKRLKTSNASRTSYSKRINDKLSVMSKNSIRLIQDSLKSNNRIIKKVIDVRNDPYKIL